MIYHEIMLLFVDGKASNVWIIQGSHGLSILGKIELSNLAPKSFGHDGWQSLTRPAIQLDLLSGRKVELSRTQSTILPRLVDTR